MLMSSVPQLVAAGAAGVLIHNAVFIHGEWHLQSTILLGLHFLVYVGLILLEALYLKLAWVPALTISSQVFGTYTLCLLASMIIYRIFFHRLRNFPGPFLASVSKLWHFAHCLECKNHLLLERLHREYGDFVRTGTTGMVQSDYMLNECRTLRIDNLHSRCSSCHV